MSTSTGTRVMVGLTIATSATVICASLVMVGFICRDINNLYDEVMDDMVEFKGIANDAWQGMMTFQRPSNGKSNVFTSIFRIKRQYDSA
uniref:Nematode cuticle collagen N-terminal domain-containing protein n=1 Tax=Panagrolaimus superbus TaxID=310955 RepID=A0A914XUT5_9BILA